MGRDSAVALADVDVGEVEFSGAGAGGFEHGGAGIDGDDLFYVGGEEREHCAGAGADVGDGPGGIHEGEEAFEVEGVAEPLGAEVIPLGGVLAEEGFGGGFALAENGGEAVGVGFGDGVVVEVGAGEGAELFAGVDGGGFGEFVEHAGAFAAGVGEMGVGKSFEVAGDGGLGEFEDIAEFADGETTRSVVLGLDFEEAHDAQADGVGQGTKELDQMLRADFWRRIVRTG